MKNEDNKKNKNHNNKINKSENIIDNIINKLKNIKNKNIFNDEELYDEVLSYTIYPTPFTNLSYAIAFNITSELKHINNLIVFYFLASSVIEREFFPLFIYSVCFQEILELLNYLVIIMNLDKNKPVRFLKCLYMNNLTKIFLYNIAFLINIFVNGTNLLNFAMLGFSIIFTAYNYLCYIKLCKIEED